MFDITTIDIQVIIGNLFALAAAFLAVLSGVVKSRKRSVLFQFLHEFCCASGDLVLGGYSGAIVDGVDAARDILSYKDKLNQTLKFVLIFIASALIFYFNDMGLLGLLPLVATVFYTLTINIEDPVKYKLCLMFTWVLSLIYNLAILSFVGALVQAFALAGGLFSLFRNSPAPTLADAPVADVPPEKTTTSARSRISAHAKNSRTPSTPANARNSARSGTSPPSSASKRRRHRR